ncbi:MAG: zinc dependent phospholipase C family protein [Coriobacteriales bacterium]|jgi:hypothetical protein|nr:zinc dependent phospholipase C family protein [Coriobacteriales bacterium]
MPALLSHHIFGRQILAKLEEVSYPARDERDAFLLGNQGPDPLFYATFSPHFISAKKLASRMHREHIAELLDFWRQQVRTYRGYASGVLSAYINGFLCHYALDRTAHPLVLAYTEAICNAGVAGLTPHHDSYVHNQIEADLDVYLLYKITGRTIDEYRIPQQVLYASPSVLSLIDRLYVAAAQQLYGARVAANLYSLSVRDMRRTIRFNYSPGGTKRSLLGRIERIFRPHSLLQSMTHRRDAYVDCWYANDDNAAWLHPQNRTVHHESFTALFEQAKYEALRDIDLFESGAKTSDITRGLDFNGHYTPSLSFGENN